MQKAKLLMVLLFSQHVCVANELPLLSLDQAVEFALNKNYSIRIKEMDVEIQHLNIGKEQGAYDPAFNLVVGESETNETSNYRYGKTALEGTLPTGTNYSFSLQTEQRDHDPDSRITTSGVTIIQPLLRGLGVDTRWAAIEIADREHTREKWLLKKRVLDTILSVIESYNQLVFSAKNAEIAEQSKDLALQLLNDNRTRVEQGMMAPVDIAVAEAELAVREERLLKQNSNLTLRKNALRKLIYCHDDQGVMEDFAIQFSPEVAAPELDFERFLDATLSQLPEIQVRRIAIEMEEVMWKLQKRMRLPEVNVFASYGHRSYDSAGPQSSAGDVEDYSYGLRLQYPVGNRRSEALSSISQIRLRQEQLQLSQLLFEIKIDMDTQIKLVKDNWQRVQASQKARELSQLMLNAEQKKMKAGTSSTFVILRLQSDLAKAQIQEYLTIIEYRISLANLGRLRGML